MNTSRYAGLYHITQSIIHAHGMFVLRYLLMAFICVCGVSYLIGLPRQHQLHAVDIASDGGRNIRDLEKNNRGQDFRWLSDTVTLRIAQPTGAGILTFGYWTAPTRIATALQINTTAFVLPPTQALQPRRIAVLVFHHADVPQTTIAMQFIAMPSQPLAWAFTAADWRTVTPLPHPAIGGGIGLVWLLVALSLQRIWQRHWLSAIGASLIVLGGASTQPVLADTITFLQNNTFLWRNSILIGLGWGLWYVVYPRIVRFLTTATQAQRLTIGLYTVLTLLPVLGMLFGPESARVAVQEQRQRQDCPSQWLGSRWDVGQNFAVLSQCVSDNIGWRSLMIRSKNELDYRLFGVSSRVYFGSNDFYFLRRWGDERFPLLQQILQDPVQHSQLRQEFQILHNTYAANNIHMIVVIAPSKDIIYAEHLPWYAPRYNPQMITDFEAELRTAGIDVIPVTAILQQHKQDVPLLYHQRDFHWNSLSAYYVSHAIVARIAHHEQRATPWLQATPSYQMQWKDATDQHFAALLLNRDSSPKSYTVTAPLPGNAQWQNQAYANQDLIVWRTPTQLPQPALPNLAILGDSFSTYFRNVGLEWYFDTIITTSGVVNTPTTMQVLQHNNIKYVVIQVRDVSLPLLLSQQPEQ